MTQGLEPVHPDSSAQDDDFHSLVMFVYTLVWTSIFGAFLHFEIKDSVDPGGSSPKAVVQSEYAQTERNEAVPQVTDPAAAKNEQAPTPANPQTTADAETRSKPVAELEPEPEPRLSHIQWILLLSMGAMYPVFLLEIALVWKSGSPFRRKYLRHVIPPFRIVARDTQTWTKIWFPWLGTRTVDRQLRLQVEQAFMQPMLIVTLMVLPLLVLDFLVFKGYLESTPLLRTSAAVGETIIWVAFTVEFIVLCCLSEKKAKYCKENWIDLVVIILPIFKFLRFLRLSRLTKLTRFARAGNIYRLRGATVKVRRAVMVWEMVNRLLRPQNEKRLKKLELEYEEKREELENLRAEIELLRDTLAAAAAEPADGTDAGLSAETVVPAEPSDPQVQIDSPSDVPQPKAQPNTPRDAADADQPQPQRLS